MEQKAERQKGEQNDFLCSCRFVSEPEVQPYNRACRKQQPKEVPTVEHCNYHSKLPVKKSFIYNLALYLVYSSEFSTVEGIFMETINSTKPIANKMGKGMSAILIHVPSAKGKIPLKMEINPTPRIAALLPKIS